MGDIIGLGGAGSAALDGDTRAMVDGGLDEGAERERGVDHAIGKERDEPEFSLAESDPGDIKFRIVEYAG